jgi:hypothetical protein
MDQPFNSDHCRRTSRAQAKNEKEKIRIKMKWNFQNIDIVDTAKAAEC